MPARPPFHPRRDFKPTTGKADRVELARREAKRAAKMKRDK